MHLLDLKDPGSFEEQFRLHYSSLCAIAYRILNDENAAKDIVQDFFLYCWDKRGIIQINQNFRGYATRAIRNASLNYLKKKGKIVFQEPGDFIEDGTPLTRDDQELEETRNAALWAAIDRLPQQRRRIFLLSNRDNLKYKFIADQLDISVNTVKTQIKLAYQYLRKECDWMLICVVLLLFYDY